MERQVFISYAAKDPAWTGEKVEELAASIMHAGIAVRLDTWHERDARRLLSPNEWREWMAESIKQSTNVVCLMSELYSKLWERKETDAGGFGVAFESIRLVHTLYFEKQRNRGRILTLRLDESDYGYIPPDLALDCPHYCWITHRDILISHLRNAGSNALGASKKPPRADDAQVGTDEMMDSPSFSAESGFLQISQPPEIELPGMGRLDDGDDSKGAARAGFDDGSSRRAPISMLGESRAEAGASSGEDGGSAVGSDDLLMLDHAMLKHQADYAAERLKASPSYWAGLCESRNLRDWLPASGFQSPSCFLEAVFRISPEKLLPVMLEFCEVFRKKRTLLGDSETGGAASATVACYLICTCLLIKVEAGDLLIGLPRIDDPDAAGLLASLVALVMKGGRLDLGFGNGVLPVGSNTFHVQLVGQYSEADFERELYPKVLRKPWSVSAALKAGDTSKDPPKEELEKREKVLRSELKVGLVGKRGYGHERRSMCVVVWNRYSPGVEAFKLVRELEIPVFHPSAKEAHEVVGMAEEELVSYLNELWTDVSAWMRSSEAVKAVSQLTLADLAQELRSLAADMKQHVMSSEIRALADALQKSVEAQKKPERDVLDKYNGIVVKLNQTGDGSQKILERLDPLFRFLSSFF